jgi:chromosome segregation ATPase
MALIMLLKKMPASAPLLNSVSYTLMLPYRWAKTNLELLLCQKLHPARMAAKKFANVVQALDGSTDSESSMSDINELRHMMKAMMKRQQDFEENSRKQRQEMEDDRRKHKFNIEDIQSEHRRSMEEERSRHKKEIKAILQRHKQEMEKKEKEYETKIKEEETRYQEAMKKIVQEHEKRMQELTDDHHQRVDELQQTLATKTRECKAWKEAVTASTFKGYFTKKRQKIILQDLIINGN